MKLARFNIAHLNRTMYIDFYKQVLFRKSITSDTIAKLNLLFPIATQHEKVHFHPEINYWHQTMWPLRRSRIDPIR